MMGEISAMFPFEKQLEDALEKLNHYSLIAAKPSTVEEYDEGMHNATKIAEHASQVASIAWALAQERRAFRSDFLEDLRERDQRECDLYMCPPHRFVS